MAGCGVGVTMHRSFTKSINLTSNIASTVSSRCPTTSLLSDLEVHREHRVTRAKYSIQIDDASFELPVELKSTRSIASVVFVKVSKHGV